MVAKTRPSKKQQTIKKLYKSSGRGGVRKSGEYTVLASRNRQTRASDTAIKVTPVTKRYLTMLTSSAERLKKTALEYIKSSSDASRRKHAHHISVLTGMIVESISSLETSGVSVPNLFFETKGEPLSNRQVSKHIQSHVQMSLENTFYSNTTPSISVDEIYFVPHVEIQFVINTLPRTKFPFTRSLLQMALEWTGKYTSEIVKRYTGDQFEKTMARELSRRATF